MKKSFIQTILFLLSIVPVISQIQNPVKSSYSASKTEVTVGEEIDLIFSYTIQKDWEMYSNDFPESVGPMVTKHTYVPNNTYKLIGKTVASPAIEKFDEIWNDKVRFHKNKSIYTQRVKILKLNPVIIANAQFQACTEITGKCIPYDEEYRFDFIKSVASGYKPDSQNLNMGLKPDSTIVKSVLNQDCTNVESGFKPDSMAFIPVLNPTNTRVIGTPLDCKEFEPKITTDFTNTGKKIDSSVWFFMLGAFLAGLVALLTPCVFPMIPLTVSFFTKKGENKSKNITQAFIYGISIIVIYISLGIGVTVLFGSNTLNALSTNAVFNIIFFLMCILFGASFLGMFEINLPNSWVTKIDAKADKGGLLGAFFMAFTLVLVSFSCTGPIVGTLLVTAATGQSYLLPALGMFAFSLAFALPFTFFAIFPSLLSSLPKSGSWLNSVKVVLGFIEIALAFKFLSVSDATYHWRILDREVFLAIWIVIFALLGFYLLGKLKFFHDNELSHISVPRLFLALISFSFVLYMIPGMWGAPLKSLSGWLPMNNTQDFFIQTSDYSIKPFHDYCEGMNYARSVKKPVMLDFTGYGCVNCRRMEAGVWTDPEIEKILAENYVIISLYVDDKKNLLDSEIYFSENDQKIKKTIGAKWSEFQAKYFSNNAQPFYVLLNNDGSTLAPPRDFNLNVNEFKQWLLSSLKNYKNQN
ncbi:MAG: hypothetical protein A3G23_00695 [Bacteroidetes bacterium RIFCSPLOWO2_12_FULL_37_12]|nr:MAG: hypothetical protein A3G23_00695 [Bacteroidetes bacterium RIFCSPLOWO2_12_FULL_37_12]